MSAYFETIILRFRDLVTEEKGTIRRHQNIISKKDYVWWGWWKKGNEKVPQEEFSLLSVKAKSNPFELYLLDSGQNLVYQATCEGIELTLDQKSSSPEKDKTPEYYRDQKYYVWFKFTKIQCSSEAQLKHFSYVDCQSLFLDENTDYSRFNNKKIYSLSELIQQDRTVWFVRNAQESDLEHEIILLNSSLIQPSHFSAKYYQSSGDTLLWLSDLHLSDHRFEFKKGTPRKTLAQHLCQCISEQKIGGLLITGDITSRAEKEGFSLAKELIRDFNSEQLTADSNFEPLGAENIIICPGNHDFAREAGNLAPDADPVFIYDRPENTTEFSDFYKAIYNISPNSYFSTGRKILLSSGYMLEIVALNSLMLQQYPNFDGHGYISQDQLDFVAEKMGWDTAKNETSVRIVIMHHHYLPTCFTEVIDVTRASSAVYDSDRLMNWLVKHKVKLLLHGHKHKSFIAQVNYPMNPEMDITVQEMRSVTVVGMGGTGAKDIQNKIATVQFKNKTIFLNFYNIYNDGSAEDTINQTIQIPL